MTLKNVAIILILSIGVLIANATLHPDGTLKDKGNLDWQVANYSEHHLNNSDKSNASGFNANISPNGKDKNGNPTYGSTTLGAHRQGHDRQGQTLATIGKTKQGKQVGANQHLNRSQIITKDHQTGGLDASATLDHRLLNKAGRELIKKDFKEGIPVAVDVTKKVWTSPNTLLGLTYGSLGWALGGDNPKIRNNAVTFENNPLMLKRGGLTLGNSIHYGKYADPDAEIKSYDGKRDVYFGKHEEAHTRQYENYGPFFLPAYLLHGGVTKHNKFEKEADDASEIQP